MTRAAEIAAPWRERLAAAGLRDPAALLEDPQSAQLAGQWQALSKPGLNGRQRWRWEFAAAQGPQVVYVKRYDAAPWRDQVDRIRRQSARHSRAWWEFTQSAALAALRIPAPQAVAFVEEMSGSFERRSAVALAPVPGDAFDRVWSRLEAARATATRPLYRHDLARRLGRFIAAFHQTGMCHRDLYLCHVFAVIDPAGQQPPAFHLIDLARTHAPRWRRMRWVLKDLAQLDSSAREIGASRADRWRFLLAYLGLQPGAPRARWYASRIVTRSNRILSRLRRKQAAAAR